MAQNSLTVPSNPARALRDLNRQPAVVPAPPANDTPDVDDINSTTILQSDKPTNRPTDRQTAQQTDPQTNSLTNTATDKPASRANNRQANKPAVRPAARKAEVATLAVPDPPARTARADGRTLRVRQETADPTMVTSMRLAVSTLEALDDHCYRYRKRKQDVVQAALDLYFAAVDAED